ncbi:MAG: hypothetical protein H6Q00_1911 [Holophagaceae bacterium]|nr:hypothetical protein [Holophagaceae bacterium]
MKKLVIGCISFLLFLSCGPFRFHPLPPDQRWRDPSTQSVLLLYDEVQLGAAAYVLEAYKSVLTEEGVAWDTVEIKRLLATNPRTLAQSKPAIICPDGLLQHVPESAAHWLKDYLASGGSIAVVYDVGVKDEKGFYLAKSPMAELAGLNFATYPALRGAAYTTAGLQFSSPQASDFLQIPPGKTDSQGFLNGYSYGRLRYPITRNEPLGPPQEGAILASAITDRGERYPAVTLRRYAAGHVLYVNLPLGHLKANADDLPLRSILRAFLFSTLEIPHLVNGPNGQGSLVINWHIDAGNERTEIEPAIRNRTLDEELPASIHITAGDFRDTPGDGLGFDAAGRGLEAAKHFLPFGVIGSHGGWAHNWFADRIQKGQFSRTDIHANIARNKACLEAICGYPITEYSAPVGVHPQPMVTDILDELGFRSYYYTGDNGSAPNRTFSGGKMVSTKVIAFPMLSLGKSASLYEMKREGITEAEVRRWLKDSVDYLVKNRSTRLFYSHLHDVNDYPSAMHDFLDYARQKQREKVLSIQPMSQVTQSFQKLLNTTFSFTQDGSRLHFNLKNPDGLQGITVAIPRRKFNIINSKNLSISKDTTYYYLTINQDIKKHSATLGGLIPGAPLPK